MAVTHHSDPNQFVGIQKYSYRQYICNATWDDLEEESHISRTMNLWGQGHHRPIVGSSMRDVLETIRLDRLPEKKHKDSGIMTDSQQAQGPDPDARAPSGSPLAPKEARRTAHEKDGHEL